jgi:Fic family protein
MNSLNISYLDRSPLPLELSQAVQKLGEYKGKQDLYMKQTPQILDTLKQAAIIQSSESSNRIEGITVIPERLKVIMADKAKPKDRPETEIVGYRNVLAKIHTQFETTEINPKTILKFHAEMLKGTGSISGTWKQKDNTIEEKLPDGRWISRFVPVSARETPYFMEETCKLFNRLWNEDKISKLILIPSFILDFLCIHPFTDGNGRISRLLTTLLLHKSCYEVGRYISLEKIVEDSKESYYEVLLKSSQGWHDNDHKIRPWWEYFLGTVLTAYKLLEERVNAIVKVRGAKTNLIENAVDNMPATFTITDLEKACPSTGRDMIRVVLNNLRKDGRLKCTGLGRGAKWRKV